MRAFELLDALVLQDDLRQGGTVGKCVVVNNYRPCIFFSGIILESSMIYLGRQLIGDAIAEGIKKKFESILIS